MPTYQYSCTECGHFFEQVQSFSEDSLTTCPVCSGRLRKVFNAVGVVFKGSGFYRTDSRSAGAEASAPKETSGGGDGASGAGSDGGSAGKSAPAATSGDGSSTASKTESKGSSSAA